MQRICWLFWSVALAESLTSHLRRALQAVSDPVNPCIKMSTTVAGDIIQPVVQTTNAQQCSSRCMDNMKCEGFTFSISDHTCSLRHKLGETSAASANDVAGIKSCFVSDCFKAAQPADGYGILREIRPVLQGLSGCVAACVQEHGICHAVSYDGSTCQLMFLVQEVETHEISKMVDMHCLFPSDYMQLGTDVTDKYLAKFKDVSVQILSWTSCGGIPTNYTCGGLFEPQAFDKLNVVFPGEASAGYTYKLVQGSSPSTINIVCDNDGGSSLSGKPLGSGAKLGFQTPAIDWKFYHRGGAVMIQQANDATKNFGLTGRTPSLLNSKGLWTIHVPLESDPTQCFVTSRRYQNPIKSVPTITTSRRCVNICLGTPGCHAGTLGPGGDCTLFKAYDQTVEFVGGFVSFRMDCLFPNSEEFTVHEVPTGRVSLVSAHNPSYGWSVQLSDDGVLTGAEGTHAAAVWSITPDQKDSPKYYTMKVAMAGSPHNGKYVAEHGTDGMQVTTDESDAWMFTVDPSGAVFRFDTLEAYTKLRLDGDKVVLGDLDHARWDLIKA